MQVLFAVLLAAVAQKYEGQIKSWDAKSGKIHLVLTDQSTGDWTVLPDAKVFHDGKPSAQSNIHAGEQVEVAVTPEGNVQTVWVIPPMWGKPFEGGKLKRWDGRITGFERHDPNFQFQIQQLSGTGTIHFVANAKTRWKRGRADASVDDAKQGQTVTVLLSPADRQVTEVMIRE
jgi:hypothetical protein